MRISDWSSDVCSSDLICHPAHVAQLQREGVDAMMARQFEGGRQRAQAFIGQDGHPVVGRQAPKRIEVRSEEHTSELQSLLRISYAVFCLKKKKQSTIISQ